MLLLTLRAGNDLYALKIDKVREIIPVVEFSSIPDCPPYLKGLINYRGNVCPVIDLSIILKDIPSRNYLSTRIIMFDVDSPQCSFGLLAEQVTETVFIDSNELNPVMQGLSGAGYVDNTIIMDGKIVKIINPEKIISDKSTIFTGINTI
ncbi:MAG: chemotaxis protein CheW [Candidatus Kapaibacterium sp.]|jgi:chemotaxis signal transduction protein